MMVKSGLEFFYFEILYAPSEIPANLPGPFSLSWQIALHLAEVTLKGHLGFQKKMILDHFSPSFLNQKWLFQELRFQSTYSSHSRWCWYDVQTNPYPNLIRTLS
jgi:hypothetical protein